MVLLHITLKVPGADQTWLATLNTFLDPLRLPLFFLVSGYFSYKVFCYSFPELFIRRLWFFSYPILSVDVSGAYDGATRIPMGIR